MAELGRWKKMRKSMLESRNLKICLKESTKINKKCRIIHQDSPRADSMIRWDWLESTDSKNRNLRRYTQKERKRKEALLPFVL